MAHGLQRLIEFLSGENPASDLCGRQSLMWAAPSPEARLLIRQSITGTLSSLTLDETTALMILKNRPGDITNDWSISISHTQTLGAWVATRRPQRVGLDLEQIARLTPELINRVCSAEEIATAPDPRCLWSAKEATFKAMPPTEQPAAISQIRVQNWREPSQGLFTFDAVTEGCGALTADDNYVYAVFLRR